MNHISKIAPFILAAGCSTTPTAPPASIPQPAAPLVRLTLAGPPLGIAWGMIFGPPATQQPPRFLPAVRQLGGGFTKVNLTWGQLEPQEGQYDWELLDAYLDQLSSPDEGLLAILSSSPWGTRVPAWFLPPSPARDLDHYHRFVRDLVTHARGRVRYFQGDSEANNPIFWAGTKDEYLAQLRVFSVAVREADPQARVVLGGSDGLFDPSGADPMPGQQASLDLLDMLLTAGRNLFDVVDLHLYADPYTIGARVDFVRSKMHALGLTQPIIATEYDGPGFFEFPANRRYFGLLQSWGQSVAAGGAEQPGGAPTGVASLYQDVAALAPETQMFLMGCSDSLEKKLRRIQARDLVMRNVFALAAGVQKTAFWDLWHDTSQRDDVVTLLYGKLKLMESNAGMLDQRYPIADAFARMAEALAGVESIQRLALPGHDSIQLFEATRRGRGRLYIAWERRDVFSGEDAAAVPCAWATDGGSASAHDVLGNEIPVALRRGVLSLPLSVTPVFIELEN
jgi:hypothetical protein